MNNKEALEELAMIQELIGTLEKSLKRAPEGKLYCEMNRGKYLQYYHFTEEKKKEYPKGKYIQKKEIRLAYRLAQRDYELELLKNLKKRRYALNNYIKSPSFLDNKDMIEHLPKTRKCLINPYICPDDDYIKKWYSTGLDIKNDYPISTGYTTERGELVRSKSEKMIADKLYYEGINYKYEQAIKLRYGGIIFPDFTILNINKRKTCYIEHFGMMDNPEYCRKALEKIDLYEKNDLLLGDSLFVTFESSQKGLNMDAVLNIINRLYE